MIASWTDIENAIKNDTIESLDKSTLEAFSKVSPPNFQNPGLIAYCQNAQQRILRRLSQIELHEQEQREEARHKKNIRIAVLTLLFAAIAAWPIVREWIRPSPKEMNISDRANSLALADRCSQDGKLFFKEYVEKNSTAVIERYLLWDEPEFHYNARLNACLIHVSYSYFNPALSSLSNHFLKIINVLSNQSIIVSEYQVDERTGQVSLMKNSTSPNYDKIEYFNQKTKLFNE